MKFDLAQMNMEGADNKALGMAIFQTKCLMVFFVCLHQSWTLPVNNMKQGFRVQRTEYCILYRAAQTLARGIDPGSTVPSVDILILPHCCVKFFSFRGHGCSGQSSLPGWLVMQPSGTPGSSCDCPEWGGLHGVPSWNTCMWSAQKLHSQCTAVVTFLLI